jgi:hypothetical protein
MSHFTVLVVGDDIEKKLAPYDENMEVAPRIGVTAGEVAAKKEEIVREIKEGKESKEYLKEFGGIDKLSLVEFAKKWYGGKVDGKGNVWTTYNPSSKWDWWEIGGRWRGMLLLKSGAKGKLGEPGTFNNEPKFPDGVDQARFGDIDWDKMRNDPVKKLELEKEWDLLVAPNSKGLFKPEYYLERYSTKEEFVRRNMLFTTHAVITDVGAWYEVGEMGWWGLSSETADEEKDWEDNYWDRFLKDLRPETLLSVVDCHI